eukprot:CAMPEP_0179053624 /NCGR_PEP_ID=MMETSP0796-20121207/22368_1 /TAXON_ID=73915 /ORGANISM="Pyrodinium bahamense, Strain pbaha01" /LENGTH=117 /DNA_ID=CAMNT_0020750225 /DNA_START=179 /DNA_END=530 /DNA_ORIENTATION=-
MSIAAATSSGREVRVLGVHHGVHEVHEDEEADNTIRVEAAHGLRNEHAEEDEDWKANEHNEENVASWASPMLHCLLAGQCAVARSAPAAGAAPRVAATGAPAARGSSPAAAPAVAAA